MIATTVKTIHVATAVLNTLNSNANVIDSNIRFNGKLISVPIAVSLIDSIHAFLSPEFITLSAGQINQSVLELQAYSIANRPTRKSVQ